MGKGKGAFEFWATRVAPGRVIFEIGTPPGTTPIREELAREGNLYLYIAIVLCLLVHSYSSPPSSN